MFKQVLSTVPEYQSKDTLIDVIRQLIFTLGSIDRGMKEAEDMINEHFRDKSNSRLSKLIPKELGTFFTELKLVDALHEYDTVYAIKERKYIPPSFNEIRHILNLAQLRAVCTSLRLITFDADGTIYDDGSDLEKNNPIIPVIIQLLDVGLHLAIITAAGYPRDPISYEKRFSALLEALHERDISEEKLERFFVVGGECNYLFRMTRKPNENSTEIEKQQPRCRLEFVPAEEWLMESFRKHEETKIQNVLDEAQHTIEDLKRKLKVDHRFKVVRKERAIGMVRVDPNYAPRRETLDEIAVTIQARLLWFEIPFCAFNGGKAVWVDIGHKSIAVQSLLQRFGLKPTEVLHVGDQMSRTGNDYRARTACATLWIANPKETKHLLKLIIQNHDSFM